MEDRKQRESQEMTKKDTRKDTLPRLTSLNWVPCPKVSRASQNIISSWKDFNTVALEETIKIQAKTEVRVSVMQVQAGNAKGSICVHPLRPPPPPPHPVLGLPLCSMTTALF